MTVHRAEGSTVFGEGLLRAEAFGGDGSTCLGPARTHDMNPPAMPPFDPLTLKPNPKPKTSNPSPKSKALCPKPNSHSEGIGLGRSHSDNPGEACGIGLKV